MPQLFERGGLNHPLDFLLTAVAFQSADRPEAQVVLCYQPSNMTISLLPVISDDGADLTWVHQGGSAVYTTRIDTGKRECPSSVLVCPVQFTYQSVSPAVHT